MNRWAGTRCAVPAAILAIGCSSASEPTSADAMWVRIEAPRVALVGQILTLHAQVGAAVRDYQWDFGDGRRSPVADDGDAEVVYDRPGRYHVAVTVTDTVGRRHSDSVAVAVTYPPVHRPQAGASVTTVPGRSFVAVVSPDAAELSLFQWDEAGEFELNERFATCADPRTVIPWREWLAVVCQEPSIVDLVPAPHTSVSRRQVQLSPGALPFSAVPGPNGELWVSLQALGSAAIVDFIGDKAEVVAHVSVVEDVRGLAQLPDGRIAASRWRSTTEGATIAVIDPTTREVAEEWRLPREDANSEEEGGGVLSYLGSVVVSPNGVDAVVPGLRANAHGPGRRAPQPLTFSSTVRAALGWLPSGAAEARVDTFEDRGFARAAVFSPRGDYLYVAMRGSRSVERIDVLSGSHSGTALDIGFAPEGLAISDDGAFLFVDTSLSRELVVIDTADFGGAPAARLPTASAEPLSDEILLGKRLFNDSLDRRLAAQGYISCAHCHLDGMGDGRVWDFTARGEGLRNTTSLLGRGGTDHGPVHWSGNFDEIQDFEHDIRGAFGGAGLLADAKWDEATPLGQPKAGESEELDALAAYVSSLTEFPTSPYRDLDGQLLPAAERGRVLFFDPGVGCSDCHSGSRLTDSRFAADGQPVLHDVGTLSELSGGRLGGELTGVDTPTLHGLWLSAPYLHDGSAANLQEVLTVRNPEDRHGTTSHLGESEIGDLVAYLLSLDGRVF